MRNTAFVTVGLALLILQSNLFRLLGALRDLGDSIARFLQGFGLDGLVSAVRFLTSLIATPNLVLPLIVFTGVHEYSLARGVALAFVLGYALDLFAAAPVGLMTFISVTIFLLARMAGLRLAAQTVLTQIALGFVFALVQASQVWMWPNLFGNHTQGFQVLATIALPSAVSTAIAAPFIFRLAEQIHRVTITVPGPGEGPVR